MKLYHTGFLALPAPDIRHGRANADFGQGFYTSPEGDFSRRWARARRGQDTVLNTYELTTDGLRILTLSRDEAWFGYVRRNRAGQPDIYKEYDVITGPIANDTIYDTWGLLTGGLLTPAQALSVLTVGPAYTQTVIKTDRAAAQLRFLGAEVIAPAQVEEYRKTVKQEEQAYQNLFAQIMESWDI